jgi:hypothetical protein
MRLLGKAIMASGRVDNAWNACVWVRCHRAGSRALPLSVCPEGTRPDCLAEIMVRMRRGWRGRFVMVLVLVAVIAGTVLVIWARHRWPKAITGEDVAIFGSGLTLASTLLAYGAASESRSAATESRRALALHYRPGEVVVRFDTRSAEVFQADRQLEGRLPLHAVLIFHEEFAEEYRVEWLDVGGRTRSVQLTPNGMDQRVLLEGIEAHEVEDGPGYVPAAVIPRLTITCRDQRMGSAWTATRRWERGGPLGSHYLNFEFAE